MKRLEQFDEFEEFLAREPAPDIDYSKSREVIFDRLNSHSRVSPAKMNKKRLVLIAAIIASLAAYPVYSISHSFFMEFRSSNESISVKYKSETEDIKDIIDEMNEKSRYIDKKYKDVIEKRSNALEPGAAEVIIVRNPGRFSDKFLVHTIAKGNYIEQFDLFTNRLKDESGFEALKSVSKLPGSFEFSKGELRYRRDFYVPDDEKEALMIEAERSGKSYAVKSIKNLDEIGYVRMVYKNMKDENFTLSIGIEYKTRDTYNLPDESAASIEKLIYKGNEIITFKLHNISGTMVRKEYHILANDLFFIFSFSKDIKNDDALEIIDVLAGI